MRVVSSIEEIYVGSHEPRLIFRNLALASLTIEYILRLGLLVITPSSLAIWIHNYLHSDPDFHLRNLYEHYAGVASVVVHIFGTSMNTKMCNMVSSSWIAECGFTLIPKVIEATKKFILWKVLVRLEGGSRFRTRTFVFRSYQLFSPPLPPRRCAHEQWST